MEFGESPDDFHMIWEDGYVVNNFLFISWESIEEEKLEIPGSFEYGKFYRIYGRILGRTSTLRTDHLAP